MVSAALFAPLIGQDPLLSRDDQTLLNPLRRLTGPSGYAAAVSRGEVLDLQPLRDASFAVDLWLSQRAGFGTFHATSWALFAVLVFAVRRLFIRVAGANWLSTIGTMVFALHPVFATSVGWVSARKHLLSCLFIVLATLGLFRWLERRKLLDAILTLIAFACSVASQPITALWPVFALALTWSQRRVDGLARNPFAVALAALPLSAFTLFANATYYSERYVAQASGVAKFVEGTHFDVSLLALGRSFFNLVCPIALATTYDPGRSYNLAGLLSLPIFAWLISRRVSFRAALPWVLLSLLPLAIVIVKMTNVFVSDTYLLTPGIALIALVMLAVQSFDAKSMRVAGFVAAAFVALCLYETHRVVQSDRSDTALWAHAYDVEPMPSTLAKHIHFLTLSGDVPRALELSVRLLDESPTQPDLPMVLSAAAYRHPTLTWQEKDTLLTRVHLNDPWFWYFHGLIKAGLGQPAEGDALMRRALQARPDRFKSERSKVVADAKAICARASETGCDLLQ